MWRLLIPAILAIIIAVALIGCEYNEKPSGDNQRRNSVEFRTTNFERAAKLYPLPAQENFPLREALVEYTRRQDLQNHPWYIYVLGQNGNPIGYFVGKTYPQNACNFLSSTEEIRSNENGTVVLTAPSLDGIFYGGSGASGACTSYFFFDVSTNAMQVIDGLPFFVSDAPLALDVKPIRVAQ